MTAFEIFQILAFSLQVILVPGSAWVIKKVMVEQVRMALLVSKVDGIAIKLETILHIDKRVDHLEYQVETLMEERSSGRN